ncbi:MAG: tail fiber protein [Alphaproteobacteria bacterium]|nr:tail fiber protein [Alphaproteobacteria bacterium]
MGSFSSKSTSKTTPIVNEPMNANLNSYAGKVSDFLATDPSRYVAPALPLQEQAFAGAQNLGGWQAPSQQALGMAQNAGGAGPSTYQAPQIGQAGQAQSQSLLTNFDNYMNPYTKDVVNATMADFDTDVGRRQAALQAAGAKGAAFGGSRWGVEGAQFGDNAIRARASTQGNLLNQAFNTAAGLSNLDAARRQDTNFFNTGAQNQFRLTQGGMDADASRYNAGAQEQAYQRALQAAGLTANIGQSMGASERADLGTTADLGAVQRMIEEARLQAPINQLIDGGKMYGMIPPASYIGANNVTKGTTPWGPAAIGAIGSVASAFASKSERRLKRDIEKIGEHRGLGLYTYNYIWDPIDRAPRTGLMVDEVERIAPHALGPLIDGDKTVDYAKLGLAHLVEGK